jgi:CheY-like chemotaxis protein
MRILVVDDLNSRHFCLSEQYAGHEIHKAWNYYQAVELLSKHRYDLVSLDYDLEWDQPPNHQNGAAVARYIVGFLDTAQRPRHVVIHSWNPNGAQDIARILKQGEVSHEVTPFRYKDGSGPA